MLDVEPLAVELVLLVLGRVLLPLLVLGVSLRTCLVTLSQHFIAPGEAALGEGAVVEVWAADPHASGQHRGGDQSNSGHTHSAYPSSLQMRPGEASP